MGVSNPQDDLNERNLGVASVALSTVIPRVGNDHLRGSVVYGRFQLISDSYILQDESFSSIPKRLNPTKLYPELFYRRVFAKIISAPMKKKVFKGKIPSEL